MLFDEACAPALASISASQSGAGPLDQPGSSFPHQRLVLAREGLAVEVHRTGWELPRAEMRLSKSSQILQIRVPAGKVRVLPVQVTAVGLQVPLGVQVELTGGFSSSPAAPHLFQRLEFLLLQMARLEWTTSPVVGLAPRLEPGGFPGERSAG